MPNIFKNLGKTKFFVATLVIASVIGMFVLSNLPQGIDEARSQTSTYSWIDVWNLWTNITIDSLAADTSFEVEIRRYGYFGIQYMTESTLGTPKIDIVYQLSMTTDYWSTAADSLIEDDLTTENTWYIKSFNPPPARYLRIIVRGQVGNRSDSTIWMWLATGS